MLSSTSAIGWLPGSQASSSDSEGWCFSTLNSHRKPEDRPWCKRKGQVRGGGRGREGVEERRGGWDGKIWKTLRQCRVIIDCIDNRQTPLYAVNYAAFIASNCYRGLRVRTYSTLSAAPDFVYTSPRSPFNASALLTSPHIAPDSIPHLGPRAISCRVLTSPTASKRVDLSQYGRREVRHCA